MKLKVYDLNSNSWEAVEGQPLPEQICKPFSVNSWGSNIYVLGQDLHVAMGKISKVNLEGHYEKKFRFGVRWHVEDAPMAFSDLTPSSS
ncbi:hypothetical protein RDABS01_016120 [Bienertia sinuspersici]